MSACKCGVSSLHCICWTNSVQISESSVVSAAASADRESTEAGMGMPEALSGGLGVSLPAAPSTGGYTPITRVTRTVYARAIAAKHAAISTEAAEAEFDRWLAEVKAEAWDECLAGMGWALANGPDDLALQYVRDHNPHKNP